MNRPIFHIEAKPDIETHVTLWGQASAEQIQATVVIPLHNLGNTVSILIENLSRTDLHGAEVILVDDGSIDGTWDLLNLCDGLDIPALFVRFEVNQGVAAVRNWAVNVARGEYIWFIDGDDRWYPNSLCILLQAAHASHSDIVFAQAERLITNTNRRVRVPAPHGGMVLSHRDMVEGFLSGTIQGHLWNKLFRRPLFDKDTFPIQRSKSDAAGVLRLIRKANSGVTLSDIVYEYRFHKGSIATSNPPVFDLVRVMQYCVETFNNEVVDHRYFQVYYVRCFAKLALVELWRSGVDDDVSGYIERLCQGMMPYRSILTLVRMKEYRLAAFVVSYRLAPKLLRLLYVASRRTEW